MKSTVTFAGNLSSNSARTMKGKLCGFSRSLVRHLLSAAILLLSGAFLSLSAATLPAGFTETLVANGLSAPTAMAFAPDGRLFVCLQGGQLRVIKNGALLATPFLTVSTDPSGERGLLGVTFDPNFVNNGFVYIYYTTTTAPQHNRVSRFTANGDVAVAGSETIIFELDNLTAATNHNGGAIHFGPDGKLYIAVGENAVPAHSQSLSNVLGKVLRINADGTIPADNPFFNTASGKNRAIWALGLRNPFTFAFQPGTGRMFINDVGQSVWEEINEGARGANYGWPDTEGPTSNPNFRTPLFSYQHGSGPTTGCAITGGTFYNPSITQFPGAYVGSYFFADLCSGWIRRLDTANNNAVSGFATGISQPVDLKVGPDGALYYLARGSSAVFRIQYSASVIALNQSTHSIREDAANTQQSFASVVVDVVRSGDATAPATVQFSTSDTSGGNECNQVTAQASQRCDYTFVGGTLRFGAGEASKQIRIPVINDGYVEGNETLTLRLQNPTGAALGTVVQSTITIEDDDSAPTTGANNPYLNNNFFVRMNYLDFLSREPDSQGFTDWLAVLNNCGSQQGFLGAPPACDRAHVSHGFYASPEFTDTGLLIYRMYEVGAGRLPRYSEFIPDMASLSGFGVPANIQQQNLQEYLQQFIAKPFFLARFGDALQPGDAALLIQKLETAAGVTLPATATTKSGQPTQYGRQELINLRAANTLSLGQTLKAFVEQQPVYDRFFLRGQVTTLYFAYLKRDPDLNDPSLTGWTQWLNVFINGGVRDDGVVIQPRDIHHLIFGFIYSEEYRKRFGAP